MSMRDRDLLCLQGVPTKWEIDFLKVEKDEAEAACGLFRPHDFYLNKTAEYNKHYDDWIREMEEAAHGKLSQYGSIHRRFNWFEEWVCQEDTVRDISNAIYVDGINFFNDNDTHPYSDFYQNAILVPERHACVNAAGECVSQCEFQRQTLTCPPFHLHYTSVLGPCVSNGGSSFGDEASKEILKMMVGHDGCHMAKISEASGVAWIWYNQPTNEFQIWGPKDNLLTAIQHIRDHELSVRNNSYLESDLAVNVSDYFIRMVIGNRGCHLRWIAKKARVRWIEIVRDTKMFRIWGSPANRLKANNLLKKHIVHISRKTGESV